MKLYFECNMGAAGDMLASALVDLFEDKSDIIKELNSLNLPHTVVEYEEGKSCGISAVHIHIVIDGKEERVEHSHHSRHGRNLEGVFEIIETIKVNDKVKNDVKEVYKLIAEAESKVHNVSVGEVHFHELGMLDAIADITIVSYLINKLSPEKIIASPINAGNGTVKCAHGVVPVPAPATAELLSGIPYYKSDIYSELCTPTGAALLRYFTEEFSKAMSFESVEKIGVGMGKKEFETANIIRAVLFSSKEEICELSCNVDDMTGEEIAFAAERITEAGALDCFVTPVFMKKGRPAYMLTVLIKTEDEEKFVRLIFKHTTTIGIRKYTPSRYTLKREIRENAGVRIKRSEGCGTVKEKPEFEDVKALALKEDISVFEARKRINKRQV